MKISLLENGLHSLNKGYNLLSEYEKVYEMNMKKRFLLKDTILSIHHGIEILMKVVLSEKSEFLIFSNIDKAVKQAYKEKKQKKYTDIFQTEKSKDIHTVTYLEALERLEFACDSEMSKELKGNIFNLDKYRNVITHSAINLNEVEVLNLLYKLANDLDFYFLEILKDKYTVSKGYVRFNRVLEEHKKFLHNRDYGKRIKLFDCIVKILREEEINLGINEVIIVNDINKAYNFLNKILKKDFYFGCDLYNGFCSGSIKKIARDAEHFTISTKDNGSFYSFKFKALLISIPSITSNTSPFIFLESVKNTKFDEQFSNQIIEDKFNQNKKYIKTFKSEKGHIIYGDNEFYASNLDQEEEQKYSETYNFLSPTILAFLNIQGFDFELGSHIIRKVKNETLENLKPIILDYYREK